MTNTPAPNTLVIRLGQSPGDLDAGRALREDWHFSPVPAVIEASAFDATLGARIERADAILIVATLDEGLPPGQVRERDGTDLGRLFEKLTATGETDLVLALAIASWQQMLPEKISLITIQPQADANRFSPRLAASVDALLFKVIRRLESWGHAAWRSRPLALQAHA